MVFGELLGGLAVRAGERFNENTQRQRQIEDWQRQAHLGLIVDQMRNWDNLQADQQMALGQQAGKLVGAKRKDVEQWITASKAIHDMIPQIQAVPESLGKPRIEVGQLPQPADVLTPSIMAPTTGGMASFGRDMTPNQIKAQQLFDQKVAERKQFRQELAQSGLSPDAQEIALGKQFGADLVRPIVAGINADAQRYKVDKNLATKGALKFYVVPGKTPGSSHVIHGRELGGRLFDEATGEQIILPPEAEPIQKQVVPTVNDAGDLTLTNAQRAIGPGNYRATIEGVGRRTQPRVTGSGRGGAEEDWNALADAVMKDPSIMATLTPTARTKITPILSARGFNQFGKPMDDSQMKQLAQSESSLGALKHLSKVLKDNEDKLGPLAGWWGTLNPYSEARKVKADIDRVRQDVGKTLEGGVLRKEDEIKFKYILATLMDTPETAQYKLEGVMRDIERAMTDFRSELSKGGRATDLRSPKTGSATWSPEKRARYEAWKHKKAGGR